MGSFLNSIDAHQEHQSQCPLINLSIAKIRELHGGFKSTCDNFAINLTEF
jgi:Ca2+-binding EF-hand superfamily protein